MRISDWSSDVCSSDLFKHTPVRVDEFRVDWQGVAYTRGNVDLRGVAWWARVSSTNAQRYEFAGRGRVGDRAAWARMLLGVVTSGPDWIEYCDDASGIYHAAYFENGRLQACLYIAPPTMQIGRASCRERVCQYG